MSKLIFLLFLITSSQSFAVVQVAFLEGVDPRTGSLIQLSPGERFYHVAVQIDGLWYDSLPKQKVIGREKLRIPSNTFLSLMIEHDDLIVSKERARKFVGWGFDYDYSWTKSGKTYCSRLVANILGVEPSSGMLFKGKHWSNSRISQVGKLGISPDELLVILKEMGFEVTYDRRIGFQKKRKPVVKSCSSLL